MSFGCHARPCSARLCSGSCRGAGRSPALNISPDCGDRATHGAKRMRLPPSSATAPGFHQTRSFGATQRWSYRYAPFSTAGRSCENWVWFALFRSL